ncbi:MULTISPECIES: DUF4181 domain-containing protein [Sporosarcina]|uniref:DUF4181 domain-containing protein n=1 Tax=Sporosarcina TaxID=1569 RepID=UPI00058D85AB|nr:MULTISPECIES: DUF4181 domain-containing protein [Sporosarcina]WJY28362.1 DUF4181 domain-containing protein [Sporosarcina sp. 0.2-SM1T-5]
MSNVQQLMVILVGILLFFFLTIWLVRKLFKVKTPFRWVAHSVNDRHRRIDWTLRAVFIFLLIGLAVWLAASDYSTVTWLYVYFLYVTLSNVILESIRGYMQKKYSEDPAEYKVTFVQTALMVLIGVVLLTTRFFGLIV